jgi:hypothetical protein
MKLRGKALFLQVLLALAVLAAGVPAEARSTTGWNSFRVWAPLGANNCVGESFGAAVNVCNSNLNLTFEMVADTAGWKKVEVWDSPGGYGTLTCSAITFSGQNDGLYVAPWQTFSPSGQELLTFWTYVYPGWAMSLYCHSVQPGRGIATLNWNPA